MSSSHAAHSLRIAVVGRHLGASRPGLPLLVVARQPASATRSALRLLTDEQVQRFVVDGFIALALDDDFPAAFHHKIYTDAKEIFERSGRQGGSFD